MKVLSSHLSALGATRRARFAFAALLYGATLGVAILLWCAWQREVSKETLAILATVQSVIATVLLTVMGSIYSGLPSAMRRAQNARRRAPQSETRSELDVLQQLGPSVQAPSIRAEFEGKRLAVLQGLFSHAAAAVALALVSLPPTVVAVQLRDSQAAAAIESRQWLSLVVLVLCCWTLAVVFLVLIRLHELVRIDVGDSDPAEDT